MAPEMKTLAEWARDRGYCIIDPDGFDRSDPRLMTRLFTELEFELGFPHCP